MAKVKMVLDEPPRIKTWLNRNMYVTSTGLVTTQDSLTVPDMAMSLHEIVERFASGRPYESGGDPVFTDGQLPDLSRLDKVERAQYLHDLGQELKDITKRMHDGRQAKFEAAEKRRFDAAVQAAAAELAKKDEPGGSLAEVVT